MGYTKGFDKKEVKNYIDAAGLATDSNFNVAELYTPEIARQAISTFINSCMSSPQEGGESVWDKIIALYMFPSGTATGNIYNAKDPSKFQITFGGAIEHSGYGMQATGTSKGSSYANITSLNPANDLSVDKGASIFYHTNTLNTNPLASLGVFNYPEPYKHCQWNYRETYFNFYFGKYNVVADIQGPKVGFTGMGVNQSVPTGYYISNNTQVNSSLALSPGVVDNTLPTTPPSLVCRRDSRTGHPSEVLYSHPLTSRFGIYMIADYIPIELVPALKHYINIFIRTLNRQVKTE